MQQQFSRTALIYGREAMDRLAGSRVIIFGIGGVGGYALEALVRSGIGHVDIVDSDTVSVTNLNRQILALTENVGRYKVDVAEERIRSISPECEVQKYRTFVLPETVGEFDFKSYDYVLDAIDTVKGKLAIIAKAAEAGVPVISSMGAGNKTDPARFEVADIYKTSVCPLAKVMRTELRKMGIKSLKVVYSRETPLKPLEGISDEEESGKRRSTPGSTAFVPSVAGLIMAGEVVNDLTRGLVPER